METGNIQLTSPIWDDIRFPFVGKHIDTSTGRLDYDMFNGGVKFQANARYTEEPVSMQCQMQHDWKLESTIRPHLHWIQESSDEPNWLLAYRIMKNGDSVTVASDYSHHTLLTKDANTFSYSSGAIVQITEFGDIDMTGVDGVSDLVHFILFRDSANSSGEFGGADPNGSGVIALEFDIHYVRDGFGSQLEYKKMQ